MNVSRWIFAGAGGPGGRLVTMQHANGACIYGLSVRDSENGEQCMRIYASADWSGSHGFGG